MTTRTTPGFRPLQATLPFTARAASAWMLVGAAMTVFRTLPYAWWGTLAFDSDQAVVGLMAKHISEFRALPVYQYAASYVLILSAYVVAPFMWVLGPTPFALKLPLVLMNTAVGVWLILAITRTGIRPAVAVLLSLPMLMTSGVTTAGLMDALGMTVEPGLFVIALWSLRRRPLAFGIVAAIGFHVREFVAYAVAALVFVDVCTGVFASRAGWRDWAISAIGAVGANGLVGGIARFASVRGPDTWTAASSDNLTTLGGSFCFAPAQAAGNVLALGQWYLGLLWGPTRMPLAEAAVQTRVTQGLDGAWPVFAVVLLIALARLAWHWRAVWSHRHSPSMQLGVFLVLVGVQSVVVYALSRCGPIAVLTLRYALLGMFLPTGLALATWVTEPRAALRQVLGTSLVALAALNAWPHAQLWREQLTRPSLPNRAQLGAALEGRGIHYARSDYWTAYYVAFMTRERVVVGADNFPRIDVYERLLATHEDEVVRVTTRRCHDPASAPGSGAAGSEIVPGYYICPTVAP
jgi:hypothetical protein